MITLNTVRQIVEEISVDNNVGQYLELRILEAAGKGRLWVDVTLAQFEQFNPAEADSMLDELRHQGYKVIWNENEDIVRISWMNS